MHSFAVIDPQIPRCCDYCRPNRPFPFKVGRIIPPHQAHQAQGGTEEPEPRTGDRDRGKRPLLALLKAPAGSVAQAPVQVLLVSTSVEPIEAHGVHAVQRGDALLGTDGESSPPIVRETAVPGPQVVVDLLAKLAPKV